MDAILEYVKGFLALFLLIKVLLFLVPKNGFSKYISFFSGVILVIGILHPALQLFGLNEAWLKDMHADIFEEQMLEVSLSVDYLQDGNRDFYRQQVETLVESEMQARVEAAGFETKRVEVELAENYEIERLTMTITEGNEEEYPMFKEKLLSEYQLSMEQCEIAYE